MMRMDVGAWCNSGNDWDAGRDWPIRSYSGRGYDRFVSPYNLPPVSRSKRPVWTQLWRKIMKEKRRIFDSSCPSMRFTYDSHTYAQNFDQGLAWADPDDLSISFSARFAVPSRIFDKDEAGLVVS